MITFIASHPHTYTVRALAGPILAPYMPRTRAITYDDLFAAEELAPGSYVFTDMERLHPAELRLAARFYRKLAALRGFRVLNDPARVRTRFGLLRALADAGINDFDAYCAEGLPRPRRFPVFLRIASDHAGPIGSLIDDQPELETRLRLLEAEGIPLSSVLVVEFCGERRGHGRFEKIGFLRVGDRITIQAILVGESWTQRLATSERHSLTPAILRDQLAAFRTERHVQEIRQAFEIAGIEYGRADVGIWNGRLQVYEINTNPNFSATEDFIAEEQREAQFLFRARTGAMMHAIDLADDGPPARIAFDELDPPSRRRRERAQLAAANTARIAAFEALQLQATP